MNYFSIALLLICGIFAQASDSDKIADSRILSAIESGQVDVFEALFKNANSNEINAGVLWGAVTAVKNTDARHAMWRIMLDSGMIENVDLYEDHRGRKALQAEVASFRYNQPQVNKDLSMLKMLLERGADPNIKVHTHMSILNYQYPPLEVMKMLVEYGAIPFSWDTFFQYKRLQQSTEAESLKQKQSFLSLFISAGILNTKDSYGRTLLHGLMQEQNEDLLFMVPGLLENGADPTLPDNSGRTPIDTALNLTIKELMMEHVRDSCQKTLEQRNG